MTFTQTHIKKKSVCYKVPLVPQKPMTSFGPGNGFPCLPI